MNFLAHILLSSAEDDLKFGNFISDRIKGKAYKEYPEAIQKGILLHRKIDSYTDTHLTVKKVFIVFVLPTENMQELPLIFYTTIS